MTEVLEFMPWWKLFNRELAVRGLDEAGFKLAHDLYQIGATAAWASDAADIELRDYTQEHEVAKIRSRQFWDNLKR